MSSFMPKDFKEPRIDTSNNFKFRDGTNKIRILGGFDNPQHGVMGYQGWQEDENGNPKPGVLEGANEDNYWALEEQGYRDIKFFWALPIYSYDTKKIMILTLTQKTIREDIQAYSENEAWGDPRGYDIIVNRLGEKKNTKYKTMTGEKGELIPEITEAWMHTNIDMQRIFEGKSPFIDENEEERN
jgi:hypothetical protein